MPRQHGCRQIGRPDPRGERVEGTAHHRVAVRADDEIAGQCSSGLDRHLVADSLPHLSECGTMPSRERPHDIVEPFRLGARRRCIMI